MSTTENENETDARMDAVRTLEKGTEGFLSVLDRLNGVSREDDFKRISE